jgi:L-seryl-tRNA(Ser) seleniumtransferase
MEPRDLPSIDALTRDVEASYPDLPRAVITDACRSAIDDTRTSLRAGRSGDPIAAARSRLDAIDAMRPRHVINATGVLLHTNLGRAPIHPAAAAELAGLARGGANVELDIRTGRRSSRHAYLEVLIPLATGAESGLAVNNNAGALMLALASVAGTGGSVAVSRGELIEIGGSFRLPELMRASGATLVEVGTTNRTRLGDFEAVIDSIDAILKVHPSNYRVEGFHEDTDAAALAGLAKRRGIPFIHDVGSGLIDERVPWLRGGDTSWLAGEPGVRQSVELGADLVTFSGDKLLGGPQAGLLVGTSAAVAAARAHPVARAVRLDGGTIAAVAATLERYVDNEVLEIPFWRMAAAGVDEITARAEAVIEGLEAASLVDAESIPGAGSVPGHTIPTTAIRIDGDADRTWGLLARAQPVPIIGTRRDDAVHLDLRSVSPEDDARIRTALVALLG